ncbi:MAG: glycoside hydrolase family 3 C-terminal domain-containing protein [Candidatus Acidiferrum sp.]
MRPQKFGIILSLLLFPTLLHSQAPAINPTTPPTVTPIYLDPSAPLEQRVNDLVSRMTLEEKVSQMQDVAPAIPRLQIPAYNWWNEGLHGVARAGIATVFPQAIGLGATWDTGLLHSLADVISTEARAKYNDAIAHNNTGRYYGLTFWSPNINIFRDPRWGRGQETYGEDPFLTARLGIAFVTGLQGDDPHYLKTVSTPKHYAVHSGPETLRHRFDVPVSLHDLYDTYTPAFRATIVDGHADSVMCAYNSILDEPACANHLLFDLLRNQWGFRGYVVSDCWAISDIYQGHDYVLSLAQASALAVKAGTDLSCGPEFQSLDYAVQDRLLPMHDINQAVHRLFEARFRLGMFDPPANVPWSKLTLADVDIPANRQLALRAAQESIVLLKNDRNTLPLKSSVKSIAVIGPTADSLDVLLGNYNGTPSKYTTILAGIKTHFPSATINSAIGAPLTETRELVIPGTYLRPANPVPPEPQSTSTQSTGLLAQYFANPILYGTPALTRVDPDVDFLSNNISPGPGVPVEGYSVRWTGNLVPPVDGDYRIGATSDGGYRLYFDSKLLIDNWIDYRQRGHRSFTTLIHLQAGHAYPIKLEYFRSFRESFARLLWVPPSLTEEAVAAARKSDVVIAVVGESPALEGEERDNSDPGFFGGDRTDIYLPATQQQLLETLAATGKPLIVVLTNGSAIAVNWADQHAAAILDAWYPGEEGGTAVADVLSGAYNPAGRLPVTFYKSVAQLPPFTDYSMANRTYRYLTEQPLYPFGYGLSYSTFTYSTPEATPGVAAYAKAIAATEGADGRYHPIPNSELVKNRQAPANASANSATPANDPQAPEARQTLAQPARAGNTASDPQAPEVRHILSTIDATTFPGDSPLTVTTRVTNTSKLLGDEVVELYISHPNTDGAPIRALAGFQRIHLNPGASQSVSFLLTPRELSIVTPAGQRQVQAGPIELWVGNSQPIQIPNRPAPTGVSLKLTLSSTTPLPN